jgi:4'-phosphopantetheinyl transferase
MSYPDFDSCRALKGLEISNPDVHVWLAGLDQLEDSLSHLSELLSEDEVARAQSYYLGRDRNRYIGRHGLLRKILSLYLDVSPGEIHFNYGALGKPYLSQELRRGDIQFSLSHSDGLAIYAFTRRRRIGIDLEVIRELPDIDHIAECFFSPEETDHLRKLPPNLQLQGFLQWWACKEAYLKATGEGLTCPLNLVNISLDREKTLQVKNLESDDKSSHWSLEMLSFSHNYVAAAAIEGHDYRLSWWTCPPFVTTR